jgi:N-acetylneuraminate synthase
MATTEELEETVQTAREAGATGIVLLKCTSSYPASPADSHIRTIADMRERFGVEVGLSDHTLGIGVPLAAISLGATVIEKHFTLSRAEGGVDSAFSLEPSEMHALTQEAARAWQALGDVRYGATEVEKKALQFRRSLYIATDLQNGDILTRENIRAIRPGYGLPPKFLDRLLGKRVTRDIKRGTPADWTMIE